MDWIKYFIIDISHNTDTESDTESDWSDIINPFDKLGCLCINNLIQGYAFNLINNSISYYIDNKKNGYRYIQSRYFNTYNVNHFKNDLLDGYQYYRDVTGNLIYIEHYKNGKLNGTQYNWYDNRQIKSITRYKNDKLIGPQYHWFENGKLANINIIFYNH